jgi:hypothetical protein
VRHTPTWRQHPWVLRGTGHTPSPRRAGTRALLLLPLLLGVAAVGVVAATAVVVRVAPGACSRGRPGGGACACGALCLWIAIGYTSGGITRPIAQNVEPMAIRIPSDPTETILAPPMGPPCRPRRGPERHIVAELGEGEMWTPATLDMDEVKRCREVGSGRRRPERTGGGLSGLTSAAGDILPAGYQGRRLGRSD